MPKPSKIEPKTLQNRSLEGGATNAFLNPKFSAPRGAFWSVLGGVLGASWEHLGAVLGPSWEPWGVLGASWARLETSWKRLGAHFNADST